MIKIFDSTDTDFSNAGNVIINPTKCLEVRKKSLNDWYIDVEVPIKYSEYLDQDMLCVIKSKSKANPQAFRIKNIERKQRKIVFQARHVMFDAEDYFLLDIRPTDQTGHNALNYINDRTDKPSPFTVYSNVTTESTAYFVRKNMLEAWQVIEERWGGAFDADNWNVSLLRQVGNDNGETVVYGKNMQGISVYEDWSSVVTKLYPVGYDGLMLPEVYLESDVQYEEPYTRTVDFETDLEMEDQTEQNLITELRANATAYLEENKVPKISYTIGVNVDEALEMGDIVHIKHPLCNVLAEVVEYEYDVISKKTKSITVGNYSRDVKSKINMIKEGVAKVSERLGMQDAVIAAQTELINRLNKDGYVYIDENEILILDVLPKEKAKNVWRFGLGGIGFSSNGYEGPFGIAMTMDGQINADFITTGTLNVSRINGLSDTLNEMSASISLNQSNIQSVVRDIGNIQIGGTQLLRGTNTVTALTSTGTWANGTWRSAGSGSGTRASVSVTDSPNANIKLGWHIVRSSGQVMISQDNINMTADMEYTLSCFAKGTGKLLLQYGNGTYGYQTTRLGLLSDTVWGKYTFTFKAKGKANIYIGCDTEGDDVYFCGAKLEQGNKATDWTEAPEDLPTITYMNSQIEQTAKSITATVSETYATKDSLGNYSTTAQVQSMIKQTASTIDISVSNKSTTAGITITLKDGNGNTIDSDSGTISMTGLVKFSDLSTSGNTTINGANITTGTIAAARLDTSYINATSGKIANININANGLYYSGSSASDGFGLWKNGQHAHNSSYIIFHAGANSSNIGNAPFKVDQDGSVYATKGQIGPFTVNANTLQSDSVGISANEYYAFWTKTGGTTTSYITWNGEMELKTLLVGGSPLVKAVNSSGQFITQIRHATSYMEYLVQGYGAFGVNCWQSDTKLKENIQDTEMGGLDFINQIRHIQFDWKRDESHVKIGYSANELQKIDADVVYSIEQPEDCEYDSLLQIDETKLIPYITKALQEEDAKVNDLVQRLEKIENLLKEGV